MADFSNEETEHISLCETLDRILNKGAVIFGEVVISVANVDLIYIALQVMIGSVETVRREMPISGSNSPPIKLAQSMSRQGGHKSTIITGCYDQ
jgi:gas vesicle structural protein